MTTSRDQRGDEKCTCLFYEPGLCIVEHCHCAKCHPFQPDDEGRDCAYCYHLERHHQSLGCVACPSRGRCKSYIAANPEPAVGVLEAIARRFIGRESSVGYDHWLTGLREAFALGQAIPRDSNPIPCGYCVDKPFDHDGPCESDVSLWCDHGRLICQECQMEGKTHKCSLASFCVACGELLEHRANGWFCTNEACPAKVPPPPAEPAVGFDLLTHLHRQRAWSERTFGPGPRTAGVVDHIRKELREIEAAPSDLTEWIDVTILALDGAWRAGGTPEQIIATLVAKQMKNENRAWPDWRTAPSDKAIEHERSATPPTEPAKGSEGAFGYLLNAMENASQADSPFEHAYSEKRKAVLAYVERLEREVEQQRVQLAGVSVAALGGTTKAVRVEQGQYGWSPAYQDTLNLRLERDRLAAKLADMKRECGMLIEGCFNADAKLAEVTIVQEERDHYEQEANFLESKLTAALAREAGLREALRDACDLAAESIAYMSDYLRKKWGFDEELAKCRAALSASPEGGKP